MHGAVRGPSDGWGWGLKQRWSRSPIQLIKQCVEQKIVSISQASAHRPCGKFYLDMAGPHFPKCRNALRLLEAMRILFYFSDRIASFTKAGSLPCAAKWKSASVFQNR